jgi:ABC-type histidine transport system ATPase subunit
MDLWKISVRDIHKSFGNTKVLNGASLDVPKSEVEVI